MDSDEPDEHRLADETGDTGIDDADELDGSDGVATTATAEVDQRIVDLLSWILDTETRAKIYIHLLAEPGSTSEEIAQGTGLYPSTVREALAELHDEERVSREKRANEGAGNNPYEYTAIQPSELVGGVVDQVQQELNTIFTLDRILDRRDDPLEQDVEPVTITVDDTSEDEGEDSEETSEVILDDDILDEDGDDGAADRDDDVPDGGDEIPDDEDGVPDGGDDTDDEP